MRYVERGPEPQISAFDALAAGYDADFTTTALGRYLRSLVWRAYRVSFPVPGRLLDVGCGTGEDAVHLARLGHEVLATDASLKMLELAADKAERSGVAHRIEFRHVPIERLGTELGGERFDGVCSNFGVVNCAPHLELLVADVASLLRPDAPLVWVVMGRHVPWEWAWFLARADWRKAFRRLDANGASFRGMTIVYPSPTQLASALAPHFRTIRRRPLGPLMPPSYASGWLEHSPRLFAGLKTLDHAVSRWRPFAALADHYIVEARRSLGPDPDSGS